MTRPMAEYSVAWSDGKLYFQAGPEESDRIELRAIDVLIARGGEFVWEDGHRMFHYGSPGDPATPEMRKIFARLRDGDAWVTYFPRSLGRPARSQIVDRETAEGIIRCAGASVEGYGLYRVEIARPDRTRVEGAPT